MDQNYQLTEEELEKVTGGSAFHDAMQKLAEKLKIKSDNPDPGDYQVTDKEHYGIPENTETEPESGPESFS